MHDDKCRLGSARHATVITRMLLIGAGNGELRHTIVLMFINGTGNQSCDHENVTQLE